ncbi:MogA/MoaB family molybdenum cofactor biosynthesis protein [Angustibacter aerolatus]
MRATVVTASDRAAAGTYADRAGPVLVEGLRQLGFDVGDAVVVPDGDPVADAITAAVADGVDVVLTTGGTGIGPADRTPEVTRPLLTRELPGVAEALRADGVRRGVPTAVLSRGLAGVAGARTLVVNLPGSVGGCRDALEVLGPVLGHAVSQLHGGDHGGDHGPTGG